jgi:hypothetical protein
MLDAVDIADQNTSYAHFGTGSMLGGTFEKSGPTLQPSSGAQDLHQRALHWERAANISVYRGRNLCGRRTNHREQECDRRCRQQELS